MDPPGFIMYKTKLAFICKDTNLSPLFLFWAKTVYLPKLEGSANIQ